ncbi:hypothetical protein GOODEAATRI_032488, partial [Goodea atripinnis]
VLKFDADRLKNNLKYCLQDDVNYTLRDHVACRCSPTSASMVMLPPTYPHHSTLALLQGPSLLQIPRTKC